MLSKFTCSNPTNQNGSVLLEGLIAILIFSLGILAVVGLQANSMRITTDAKMRIDASNIANQRIGAMWTDTANLATHANANESISSLPEGKMVTFVGGNGLDCLTADCVTITITWKVPGDEKTQQFRSATRINGNPAS